MSIKTDQLQQNAAPQLTDTLLLADSAGGTAQLSLAQAAAFFGAEMVKTGNPVSAALSSKAALSAQEAVELTAVPSRTVELEASELPGFINGLPRLLLENLTVVVTGGTVASTLNIGSFYGPGRLWIQREGNVPLILTKGAMVVRNTIQILLSRLTFQREHAPESGGSFVYAYASFQIFMENCEVDGEETGGWGVQATLGSTVHLSGCMVQNTDGALLCKSGSVLSADNCVGGGNTIGADVHSGGLILLSGSTPDLMGGSANGKNGGLIVKSDGTLL